MNSYEQKQERRRERFETLSAKAATESGRHFTQADSMAHMMNGTPILVGHHSEGRHRRDIGRMDNHMRKGFDLRKQGAAYSQKAASVGTGGISSDDPGAVAKLKERIAKLEANQDTMKKTNAAIRRGNDQALLDMGWTSEKIEGLKRPDFVGRVGFPGYALTNNSGNIRRLKQRLVDMEQHRDDETQEIDAGEGVRIVDNVEENRVQIIFPGKPDADVRGKLKQWGFRWAPSAGAWQRQRSPVAVDYAKWALGIQGPST